MLDSNSPLRDEMSKIMEAEEIPVSFTWEMELKVKDDFKGEFNLTELDKQYLDDDELNDKIFKPLKIVNMDILDDFESSAFSENWARIVIPCGMWIKCLFIARDYITVIVRRIALKNTTFSKVEDAEIEEFLYDALFHVNESNSLTGVDHSSTSRTDLDNNQPPIVIDLELLNTGVEQVRKVTIGTNARNVKPEDYIKNILVKFTEDLEVDGEKAIEHVSMVEAHNKDKRDHIIIPHGMHLVDVPKYVQNHCGGVYNSSLSCFVKNKQIFVFPIYQTDRFEDEERTLTVIRISKNLMPQVERTFKIDGQALYVLGMSDALFSDVSNAKKLSSGNGVRYADSRKFLNKFVEVKDNKAKAKRKETNSEFKSVDLKLQDTVTVAQERINSNPFRERSNLAVREGGTYTFQWINSKPELLYPGMPARILYEENQEVKELRGVILRAHTSIALIGEGMTANKHGTTTSINLFALPYEEE